MSLSRIAINHLIVFLPIAVCGCVSLNADPLNFSCGELLNRHSETYQSTALFEQIQRDARCDQGEPCPRSTNADDQSVNIAAIESDAIYQAMQYERTQREESSSKQDGKVSPQNALLLSGGGAWGAFGAGFLNAQSLRDWTVITGVSTGAVQGLFLAANDYERLEREYQRDADSIAKKEDLRGLLFKGAEYNLAPLRTTLTEYLLETTNNSARRLEETLAQNGPLARIANANTRESGRTTFFVGIVEARTGAAKIVNVSEMVSSVFHGSGELSDEGKRKLAECVVGVVLASSSIPVRLTPVRIDGVVYMDGGVRDSVILARIGEVMNSFAEAAEDEYPEIYVVRNGPTVVRREPSDEPVDERPDIYRVGMRGYSTIVNQNELMSIAALRLKYKTGKIFVATADGYSTKGCDNDSGEMFDQGFRVCLVSWGKDKAAWKHPWIDLSESP